jgi:serine/threonine protein kinase
VRRGEDPRTRRFYLNKKVFVRQNQTVRDILAEVEMMKRLPRSKYFPEFHELFYGDNDNGVQKLYLIMDYIHGRDALDFAVGEEMFKQFRTEKYFRMIMWSSVQALHIMHKFGIIHGDIKPENIIVHLNTQTGVPDYAALCDFGYSRTNNETMDKGTPQYNPPEMVQRKMHLLDKSRDVWALGLSMHMLFYAQYIFVVVNPAGKAMMHLVHSDLLDNQKSAV